MVIWRKKTKYEIYKKLKMENYTFAAILPFTSYLPT